MPSTGTAENGQGRLGTPCNVAGEGRGGEGRGGEGRGGRGEEGRGAMLQLQYIFCKLIGQD